METSLLISFYISLLSNFSQIANSYIERGLNTIISLDMQLSLINSVVKTLSVALIALEDKIELRASLKEQIDNLKLFLNKLINLLPEIEDKETHTILLKMSCLDGFDKAFEVWEDLSSDKEEVEKYWEEFLERWAKFENRLKIVNQNIYNEVYFANN